jgi:hypothetical protein
MQRMASGVVALEVHFAMEKVVKIHVKMLAPLRPLRPDGYVDALEAAGHVVGDYLEVPLSAWEAAGKSYLGCPKATGKGLGDRVEQMAKPIAKLLGLDCLDAQGRLRVDSGCAKRRDRLNDMGRKLGLG